MSYNRLYIYAIMGKELLTVAEYAEKMGIAVITVYKRIDRGNLKYVKKYGRKLIPVK